jgi:hypothetical protein
MIMPVCEFDQKLGGLALDDYDKVIARGVDQKMLEHALATARHHIQATTIRAVIPEPEVKTEPVQGVPGPPCSQCHNEWYTYSGTCLTCITCGHSDSCG